MLQIFGLTGQAAVPLFSRREAARSEIATVQIRSRHFGSLYDIWGRCWRDKPFLPLNYSHGLVNLTYFSFMFLFYKVEREIAKANDFGISFQEMQILRDRQGASPRYIY